MVETKNAIIATTIIALLSLGYIAVDNVLDPTHYCEDRSLMAKCFDLSSTFKTCYTAPGNIGGKRCSSLWKEIIEPTSLPLDPVPEIIQGPGPAPVFSDYTKAPNGEDCFLFGDLRRRIKCSEI